MGLAEWHWQQVGSETGGVSRSLWVMVNMGTSRGLILLIQVTGQPCVLGRGPEAWIPGDEWLWGPQQT